MNLNVKIFLLLWYCRSPSPYWQPERPVYQGKEVEVNPETDLIVLCANCHRMVHRKKGMTLTIEELKEKIKKAAPNNV